VERGRWEIDEHRFDAFPVCEAAQRWMGPPDRGGRKRPPTYASNPTIEMRDAAAPMTEARWTPGHDKLAECLRTAA